LAAGRGADDNGAMVGFLIGLFFVGLIAGFIGRLFVRSPRRLGCLGTAVLGIIGSYAGGTLGVLLFHQAFDIRRASGIIGAIAGTVVILSLWRFIDHDDRRRRWVRIR
jgi:uncharacterized membrane protein YeaQ/YmgE (transglycosylase-associated protein family)